MYGFLLVFFSNSVPEMHLFEIFDLKPGLGSLKVIENYTSRSDTHDFLLTFHSNHGPVLHRFRDERRFQSNKKSQNFPTPVYFAPLLKGFLGIGYRRSRSKKQIDGATGPRKKFDDIFSRLDTTHQRDRQTDRRTDRQTDRQTDG